MRRNQALLNAITGYAIPMFERFSERARRVITLAHEEARLLDHGYVGTEHLLLGVLSDGIGPAARALEAAGVTWTAAHRAVSDLVGHGAREPGLSLPFTDRAKRALALAVQEVTRLGATDVEPQHILLGLVRLEDATAVEVLRRLGVDIAALGARLVGYGPAEAGYPPPPPAGGPLDQFARSLSRAARDGELDPVVGRDREIERVMQVLSRRTKNNPVLVGEPGVGKTAVVEGLAQLILRDEVPATLRAKHLYALDLAAMLAGTRYRGDFEERLRSVLAEVRRRGDVILFIDEIHTLVGAGGGPGSGAGGGEGGSLDAAALLKPLLARGELQTIGATTLDEYHKHLEKDAALERRFQPVQVGEPSLAHTIEILKGLRERYEAHHRVSITDGALVAAATLADRYISDRYLPDKAIDLVDEAGARSRVLRASEPIDDEQIAEVLANWTGIPVTKLTEEETTRLLRMEDELHRRVVGQDDAVAAVSKAIRRTRAGLKDPKRPSGSFIFAGPSGVGKTELSRTLAEFLFGTEDALIQLDMGEYGEPAATARLFGAPPGYVGYDEGGQLTERVRRRPFSVVLFDEIEKAHPDVFNALLQILEDGRLTDGQGRVVDFKNTVIILTSNLGTRDVRSVVPGFGTDRPDPGRYVHDELKRAFRPEFLNRIDDTIVFRPLAEDEIRRIVDIMLTRIEDVLHDRRMGLELTGAARDWLARHGFDPVLGARPLRRTIQREIEDPLSERILFQELKPGQTAVIDAPDDHLAIRVLVPAQ